MTVKIKLQPSHARMEQWSKVTVVNAPNSLWTTNQIKYKTALKQVFGYTESVVIREGLTQD